MRWIVAATVLAILVASAPLWAQSLASAYASGSVLALLVVVRNGVRGSPESLKLALLGGGLFVGAVGLRRRWGLEAAED